MCFTLDMVWSFEIIVFIEKKSLSSKLCYMHKKYPKKLQREIKRLIFKMYQWPWRHFIVLTSIRRTSDWYENKKKSSKRRTVCSDRDADNVLKMYLQIPQISWEWEIQAYWSHCLVCLAFFNKSRIYQIIISYRRLIF